MRIEKNARIVHKESWGDFHKFSLEAPDIGAVAGPGQFLMIKVAAQGCPLLRRPFGIHAAHGGTVDVFFKVAGHGTALLAEKKIGETLDILGPLGRGFDLDGAAPGKMFWAVAGGRGIAPFRFWSEAARSRGAALKILYGGRTAAELPLEESLRTAGFETLCSTDDGSLGFKGFVSGLLEIQLSHGRPDGLFVCGPDPMMKDVSRIALRERIPCQVSLESQMGCGFGACWGCVKRIRKAGSDDWVKICEEGPVFEAAEIVWNEET